MTSVFAPQREEGAPSVFIEFTPTTGVLGEVGGAVDGGEDEPVNEQVPHFFHEVEGECWFAGPDAVQVADVGVETYVFECTVHGDAQHAIREGQRGVDRIGGRSADALSRRGELGLLDDHDENVTGYY